jgi:hypothetical protein
MLTLAQHYMRLGDPFGDKALSGSILFTPTLIDKPKQDKTNKNTQRKHKQNPM